MLTQRHDDPIYPFLIHIDQSRLAYNNNNTLPPDPGPTTRSNDREYH